MEDEPDLTSAEGRKAACEALVKALENEPSALAQHIRLLAIVLAADIGDVISSFL